MNESEFNWSLIHTNSFYDNRPLRVKRRGCMWDLLRGNRRLLYDCVWIVSGNPAAANPTSTLGVRLGWSKFASKKFTWKLHLILSSGLCESSSSWLQVTKAQGLRAADASPAALRRSYFGKPNYLPRGVRSFRLEDSNLVDPASSHMLVSKTKPCMSKFKC